MKTHQMFLVHTTPRNLKTQQRALILNLCWRKSRDAIIFEGSIFKMFSVHTKTKTRFCDGFVWTVGLTIEIRLGFRISPV